jgi:hypothetical protein
MKYLINKAAILLKNRAPGNNKGSALLLVLLLITSFSIVISGSFILANWSERAMFSRGMISQASEAAEGYVGVLTDHLESLTALKLGNVTQSELDSITAVVAALTLYPNVQLDPTRSGIVLTNVRQNELIKYNETVLRAWTHQPRSNFEALPDLAGTIANTTYELTIYATIIGARGGARTASRTVAISLIAPHQDALYTAGDAEFCASGFRNLTSGSIRIDGSADFLSCAGIIHYIGSIESQDGMAVNTPITHLLVTDDSQIEIGNLSRAIAQMNPDAAFAPWGGRYRIGPAVGGNLTTTRFQTQQIAGTGECRDFHGNTEQSPTCGTTTAESPTVGIRRTATGTSTAYSFQCNYRTTAECSAFQAAITYLPWPFTGAQPAGQASPDPDNPNILWKGLLPDSRKEERCEATVAGTTFRTHRCHTNRYGYTINAATLPNSPGTILEIYQKNSTSPTNNIDGSQEIALIINATELPADLTINSEIPIYIQGSFNSLNSKPAKISAPRITVIPSEAAVQLQTAAVWDSVPGQGESIPVALPMTAETNVNLYGVFRSGYCRMIGTDYFGGAWESIPSVLGDWSRAGLRIVGAVEGYDETSLGAAYCSNRTPPWNQPPPSGTLTQMPASRGILYDERLRHPGFQPPGRWSPQNFPPTGSPPGASASRTQARQQNAFGGITALRLIRETEITLAAVPTAIPFPALPTIPSAIPPLP